MQQDNVQFFVQICLSHSNLKAIILRKNTEKSRLTYVWILYASCQYGDASCQYGDGLCIDNVVVFTAFQFIKKLYEEEFEDVVDEVKNLVGKDRMLMKSMVSFLFEAV